MFLMLFPKGLFDGSNLDFAAARAAAAAAAAGSASNIRRRAGPRLSRCALSPFPRPGIFRVVMTSCPSFRVFSPR
jgi:hypothetical protein